MRRMTNLRARRALARAARRLSHLLAELEDQPIDPSRLSISFDARTRAASVGIDEADVERARITIEPQFVIDLDATIARFVENGFPAGSGASEQVARQWARRTHARDNTKRTQHVLEIALQWVVLHEIAHWRLGHLGYLADVTGLPVGDLRLSAVGHEFGMDSTVTVPRLPDEDQRCLELQADFEATQLLDILHAEDAASGDASAPPTALTATRQLIAVAAGAVILLIQRLREEGKVTSSRHPIPEARAHNVMSILMGRSVAHHGHVRDGQIRLPTTDDASVDGIRTTWIDALVVFYRFLTPLAQQLGVEPIFSRPDLVPASDDLPADQTAPASARDLMLYVLDAEAGPERFVTEGCKELARLRSRNRDLMAALVPFMNGPPM